MPRFWLGWDLDPALLLGLSALWWLYARGLLAVWGRAGVDRGITGAQAWAFAGAMGTLLLALVSPLDALAEELSAAHMAQHMLLMVVAAPLFALAAPLPVLLWGVPLRSRKVIGGWMAQFRLRTDSHPPTLPHSRAFLYPILAWWLFTAGLWVWHMPRLYQAALASPLLHHLEHLTFLVTGYLFWRVVLDPVGRLRMDRGAGVLYLFAACLQAGALGIFLTLSPRVWYPAYTGSVGPWGLTPLEDQQLAGLIMWIPGCAAYAAAAAALFAAWLREPTVAAEGERVR